VHKLLERQVRRHLGADAAIPESLRPFLQAVNEAYRQADDDRRLLEHSMDVVSEEHAERFRLLQEALAESRLAAEQRHTLALLKSTLDSTTDGILVVDSAGLTVVCNRRYAEMWRIPQALLESGDRSRTWEAVMEQLKDPDGVMAKVRQLYADPEAESFDVLHFKDRRVFERYSVPHRLDGKPVGRLWSFRDVTAKQQLEDQLRQAQKMDAVGKLAGGVAHDFNNLITVMKMHCEFLAEGMDKSDPRLEDVREIGDAANRAAALTRQLLAFSRKQVLKPEVVKVNDVLAGLQGMLSRLIGEDIKVDTELAGDDPSVLADRGQLEQVVVNLAVNARDAMTGGGRLTLRTATVRMDGAYAQAHGAAVPQGLYTMISVTDTGCGIPKEIQDRIFEPFFTTKELGRGTGLGLSTVYGIVKQSNGFVWVYSEAGLGTTFKIHLPAAGAEAPAESGEAPLEHRGGTETILLAEDEEPVRNGVRRVLERHGYRVLVARNGQDALRRAAAHDGEIALLITDVVMPEMGGAPLVERLRSLRPGIRVVFMSGYTDDDIVRRGIQTGAAGFIEKPFTASALTGAVRAALDRPKDNGAA
jgi:signal transduction histidine kinase/ActR/RegA family two-component response regulator